MQSFKSGLFMPLLKFEKMLKTNNIYFFDSTEFTEIVQYYFDTGKHSFAKKALRLGLDQHPSSVNLKLLKAELLVFENKISEATHILDQIEVIEPCNGEVFFQKALILSKTNKHKEAIKTLKSALPFSEDPIEIWSMIGMEYLYLDDFENAKLNFKKCIEIDSEDYSSLFNLIYCLEMQDNYAEAILFLNSYIDKNPYSEVAWHQLGIQYFELGMFKEALTAFDYSVVIDDFFIGGYLEKAKTLEQLNRYEEAIENYLITTKLDDPTSFVYVRIGKCFEQLQAQETAIKYYKKAVDEDPLSEKGWILLTDAYYKNKNYKKALYYIQKAIEIDDTNVLYRKRSAEINIKLKKHKESVTEFLKCLELGYIEIEIYITLVDVLILLKEYNKALNILIKAKRIYRKFAEIEYRLSGLFLNLNKEEYGLEHLKKGLGIDFKSHLIMKKLFPKIYKNEKVKKTINCYYKTNKKHPKNLNCN